MKKIILLFAFLFLLLPKCIAEELPPFGCGYELTKETNPIYFGYMEDYADKLKEALEARRMFRLRGMGASYIFLVTRNGEIKDMRKRTYHGEYFHKKVKDIILSVKPLPFRDGMNVDEMLFSVYLGYESYDELSLSIGSLRYKDIFQIFITTSK